MTKKLEEDAVGAAPHTHTKRELAKLQAAHMLLQGQLLKARAEEAGAVAAKEYLCQQKHSSTKVRVTYCTVHTFLYSTCIAITAPTHSLRKTWRLN